MPENAPRTCPDCGSAVREGESFCLCGGWVPPAGTPVPAPFSVRLTPESPVKSPQRVRGSEFGRTFDAELGATPAASEAAKEEGGPDGAPAKPAAAEQAFAHPAGSPGEPPEADAFGLAAVAPSIPELEVSSGEVPDVSREGVDPAIAGNGQVGVSADMTGWTTWGAEDPIPCEVPAAGPSPARVSPLARSTSPARQSPAGASVTSEPDPLPAQIDALPKAPVTQTLPAAGTDRKRSAVANLAIPGGAAMAVVVVIGILAGNQGTPQNGGTPPPPPSGSAADSPQDQPRGASGAVPATPPARGAANSSASEATIQVCNVSGQRAGPGCPKVGLLPVSKVRGRPLCRQHPQPRLSADVPRNMRAGSTYRLTIDAGNDGREAAQGSITVSSPDACDLECIAPPSAWRTAKWSPGDNVGILDLHELSQFSVGTAAWWGAEAYFEDHAIGRGGSRRAIFQITPLQSGTLKLHVRCTLALRKNQSSLWQRLGGARFYTFPPARVGRGELDGQGFPSEIIIISVQ